MHSTLVNADEGQKSVLASSPMTLHLISLLKVLIFNCVGGEGAVHMSADRAHRDQRLWLTLSLSYRQL